MTDAQINKILKNKTVKFCYIKKGLYYNPGSAGYTDWQSRAGIFTKEEAADHARHCREVTIYPVIPEQHNKNILDEVKDLLSRIV